MIKTIAIAADPFEGHNVVEFMSNLRARAERA
jgi:hypothetical protein